MERGNKNMRDIIVIWSNIDFADIILNGISVYGGIENGYEVGEVLIELFNRLDYSHGKPLVKEIYDKDYFSDEDNEAFWSRNEAYDRKGENRVFTDDELQVLQETEDIEKFIDKIKENLKENEND